MSWKPKTRPPIERMTKFYAMIRRGDYPNARTLAAEFEVSTKTIQRDIDFLRDRIGLPITYDLSRFGYAVDKSAKLPWWV
jgi:proteasome accessory factor B